GAGRPHRELRLGRGPLRGRLQPLLPRRAVGRPRLLPAAFGARHLLARIPRGTAHRGEPRQLPARDRRQWALVVLPPVAHAGLLAVPHGLDGPGPALRVLPGALHALPRASRIRGYGE